MRIPPIEIRPATPDEMGELANRPEWTMCAFDGARMAAVGTLPEYRRQGLLRRITIRAFEEMDEQGRSVVALWASQAAIYQRYGYAQTTVRRTDELFAMPHAPGCPDQF